MSYQEVGQLVIVLGNINDDVYQEILEIFYDLALTNDLVIRVILFFKMTMHLLIVVKKNKHFLEYNGNSPIKTMKWPSSSPDLNPIENIWNALKQTVNNKRPSNVMKLLQAIRQSWEKFLQMYPQYHVVYDQ